MNYQYNSPFISQLCY